MLLPEASMQLHEELQTNLKHDFQPEKADSNIIVLYFPCKDRVKLYCWRLRKNLDNVELLYVHRVAMYV